MTELDHGPARSRILRSARVLKAYFEHKLKMQLELLTEAPAEPLSAGLQFDMAISRWGLWGLRSSAHLDDKTQSEISATFHGLLGAMDSLEERRADLIRLQEKFESALQNLPSNVIPLRRAHLPQAKPFSPARAKRWAVRLDCLIESVSAEDIRKMAFELHSESRRLVFLDYHDLDEKTRMDTAELAKLGKVTLFIPSILSLTRDEQEILRRLIEMKNEDRPLLMVGANVPYSDLRTEPAIHLDFLVLLSRAYLKLTRSFSEYKDQGLIHYFLDSLEQSPT